ncbi:MAG: TonB-dependent receptor [Bacteroidia bacterium]
MRKLNILFILISASIHAQVQQIDSIKVTANRLAQSTFESGKSIELITSADIAKMPVNTVEGLLRYVAGVNLNSRGPFGVQTDLGLRGSTFSQVLVLVDNVRLNDPLTGHFNNNIPIAISEIDRIEVIRGAASAAYGADAVGGVIHIKSKIYTANNGSSFVSSNGTVSLGQNDLLLSDFAIRAGKENWLFSAGVKTSESIGNELVNPNFPSVSQDSLYNNFFDLNTFSASVAYFPNAHWKVQLRSGFDQRKFKAKYFYTASAFDESEEEIESAWHQINIERKRGAHQSNITAGYKTTNDLFTFNPLFPANSHELKKTFYNIQHLIHVNTNQTVVLGAQGENQEIESSDRGNHKKQNVGLYFLYHLQWKGLHTNWSTRFEFDDNFGFEFVPQLSVSYLLNGWNIHSSIGKAIRGGDFTERFISHQIPNLSAGRNIGNPDLLAERSYTADLGLIKRIKAYELSATVFHRWSSNLIDYVLTNSNEINNASNLIPDENYLYTMNLSESYTNGLELKASKSFKTKSILIKPEINYSYLITGNPDSVVSKYLANHPIHIFNAILHLSTKQLYANAVLNMVQRNEESIEEISAFIPSSYSLLNVDAGIKLNNDQVRLFVRVYNALDVSYQEILGAQMPGRWLSYGLKWNIN